MQVAARSGESLTFHESRSSSLFTEPVVFTGRLTVSEDGRSLTKWIDSPEPSRMTLTERDIEVQNAEGRVRRISLRQRPELSAFVSSMLSLMRGDPDSLSEVFKVDYTEQAEDFWELNLTPLERRVSGRVSQLRIIGQGGQLLALETVMADGATQRMDIINCPPGKMKQADG